MMPLTTLDILQPSMLSLESHSMTSYADLGVPAFTSTFSPKQHALHTRLQRVLDTQPLDFKLSDHSKIGEGYPSSGILPLLLSVAQTYDQALQQIKADAHALQTTLERQAIQHLEQQLTLVTTVAAQAMALNKILQEYELLIRFYGMNPEIDLATLSRCRKQFDHTSQLLANSLTQLDRFFLTKWQRFIDAVGTFLGAVFGAVTFGLLGLVVGSLVGTVAGLPTGPVLLLALPLSSVLGGVIFGTFGASIMGAALHNILQRLSMDQNQVAADSTPSMTHTYPVHSLRLARKVGLFHQTAKANAEHYEQANQAYDCKLSRFHKLFR